MGVIHTLNIFSDDQVITTASGVTLNVASTNIINLVAANYGEGNPIDVVVEISEAVVGGVAPTLVVKLESDSVEGMGVGTKKVELQTRAYAAADIQKKGRIIRFGLPTPLGKFVGLFYTLVPGAAGITGGKINAYLERREI